MAAQIAETMRDSAYEASIDLAIEKGAFPLFDADKYLEEGTFASRLPADLKERIRNHGIRNSHLLSVAPTGTVSLAFADNASNGIEPPFALAYTRKKRMPDGSHQLYPVIDHGLRQWLHTLPVEAKPENLLEAICAYKPTFIGEHDQELVVKDVLPQSLVTALEMSASDHLEMVAAIAPFIDSAISKTVNVPADYSFEDFKLIYDRAWELGIKGVATYRPNNILGSVLSVPEAPQAPALTTQEKPEKVLDIDPLTRVIGRRAEGDVESVTRKVTYNNSTGTHSLYVSVSFTKVSGIFDGREVEIERPLEVFIQAPPDGVPMEWVAALSRNLSLLARSGLLPKALQDNRMIRSDKGRVRYGVYEKADGTNVPRFHESEVACIAYAIQEILAKRGLIDVDGGAVPTRLLLKQMHAAKRHVENANHEKVQLSDAGSNALMISGKKCPECGDHTVIKKDGCEFCTSCGHIGSCG
jgi:ribonucleoside-diphosphate reductase alpha chain